MKSRSESLIRLKKFQVDEKRRQVTQIEMMIADDRPDGIERLGGRRSLSGSGDRRRRNNPEDDPGGCPPQSHLISALIGAGRSKIVGATLSYSTVVNVSFCSTPIIFCTIDVAWSMLPNFL